MLQRLPENARVAVIRIRSLGDCVLSTPALSILKNARPDLRIAVAVEPRFAAIFEGNPAVSQLLEPSVTSVFAYRPDLCLNLHGGTRSMWMTAGSFAVHRAASRITRVPGYIIIRFHERKKFSVSIAQSTQRSTSPRPYFYLGAPRTEIPRASLFAEQPSESRAYAVIHPVAATAAKTWRTDGFLKVAEHLARRARSRTHIHRWSW